MESCMWEYRNPYDWMKRVSDSSLPPLIITCALTGGAQGKESNENLPETPEEQTEQAYEAYKAGAAMVHLHVRDPKDWTVCAGNAEQYHLVNGMIREKCPDIIINNSTGGSYDLTVEERLACLDAKPEVATLNLGPDMYKMTMKERKAPLPNPKPEQKLDDFMPNTYREIASFAKAMKDRGIKPELEVYQPGMYWVIQDLMSQNLVAPPYVIQFVMGYQTSIYPTPANLLSLINELPSESIFEVAGLGPYQLPMNVMAILLGGHVRVGMEDNIYLKRGRLLRSNAEAVERIVRIARDMNRETATCAQAREMFGLLAKPSVY